MDSFMKNVANDEAQFNAQKEQLQEEVQMGETAAKIAAKAPVSPETVIETIKVGREIRECLFFCSTSRILSARLVLYDG